MTDSTSTGEHAKGALASALHAITSIFHTSAMKADQAADEARSAELLLDQADAQIDSDAEKTRGLARRALTAYKNLERQVTETKAEIDSWDEKITAATALAKSQPEGTPKYNEAVSLLRRAVQEKKTCQTRLDMLQKELDAASPAHDQALDAIKQVGLSQEMAHATRDQLDITNSSAETRRALAALSQHPAGEQAHALLDEAEAKVRRAQAGADAEEEIAANAPMSAETADIKLATMSRGAEVDAEVDALLGKTA